MLEAFIAVKTDFLFYFYLTCRPMYVYVFNYHGIEKESIYEVFLFLAECVV